MVSAATYNAELLLQNDYGCREYTYPPQMSHMNILTMLPGCEYINMTISIPGIAYSNY